ncbi:hypothetical protein BOTBODRAFT_70572 [Botryobasidium botryosum FD-172 SS1]|uniref:Cryptic loci regulator 2 N-terminal domain-containing protein n=1 Tax=Botryobasidium botryosum (strain FD-172 SS1) TaxID=930990 RepID=A0A067LVF4_BOTB1|nr:hypothetical protein BOTBODRAFT_70572 [Botryobasidium botryosum FD-172 SS1]
MAKAPPARAVTVTVRTRPAPYPKAPAPAPAPAQPRVQHSGRIPGTMKIAFPPNYTDGDSSLQYEDGEKVVDENGNVNYLVRIPLTDGTGKSWRKKIGTYLAHHVLDIDRSKQSVWFVDKLPKGYALYEHRKGPSYSPRTDHYLVGCELGHIFRSPQEFAFHAKHIFEVGNASDPSKAPPCACKYCSGTAQSDISRRFFNMKLKPRKNT